MKRSPAVITVPAVEVLERVSAVEILTDAITQGRVAPTLAVLGAAGRLLAWAQLWQFVADEETQQ